MSAEEPIKILLVDDEVNVLKSLKRLFLYDEYEIFTASSGEEGLEILSNSSPIQVVLADYRMPNMTGVEFLKAVSDFWPDTVRMVLSGYADATTIISSINEGKIYKFISKPWDDDELKITMNHALERYYLHKKNARLTLELGYKNEELQKLNTELKQLIEEKTNYNKKLLAYTTNIFGDIFRFLPIGLLSMDFTGIITNCNDACSKIMGRPKGDLLLKDRQDTLPPELNNFIDIVYKGKEFSETIKINNNMITVKGLLMDRFEGLVGIIIVFSQGE